LLARVRRTHAETSKVIAEPGTAHCSLVLRSFNGSISELSTVADADAISSDAAAAQRQERPMSAETEGGISFCGAGGRGRDQVSVHREVEISGL
jgi:hypothetical protein